MRVCGSVFIYEWCVWLIDSLWCWWCVCYLVEMHLVLLVERRKKKACGQWGMWTVLCAVVVRCWCEDLMFAYGCREFHKVWEEEKWMEKLRRVPFCGEWLHLEWETIDVRLALGLDAQDCRWETSVGWGGGVVSEGLCRIFKRVVYSLNLGCSRYVRICFGLKSCNILFSQISPSLFFVSLSFSNVRTKAPVAISVMPYNLWFFRSNML